MATLLEMAKDIVAAQAQSTPMSTEELIASINKVFAALQGLESGVPETEEAAPSLSLKQAFKQNEVICLICGKGGMKTLTRHLNQAHAMKPAAYRKQFNIPKTTPLMAKSYAAKRKEIAAGMNLGANLEKARAARQSNSLKAKKK